MHERKSRYSDFETAIHWLNCCRLALPNYPIEGLPKSPLAAYKKDNMVKLFLFDVGLLNHMLGNSYKEIKQQNYEYKGYVAENFVQQSSQLLALTQTIHGMTPAPKSNLFWRPMKAISSLLKSKVVNVQEQNRWHPTLKNVLQVRPLS